MPDGINTRIAGVVIAANVPYGQWLYLPQSGGSDRNLECNHQSPFVRAEQVAVTRGKILRVEGTLQNQDNVISVRASAVRVLDLSEVDVRSHDFTEDQIVSVCKERTRMT